MLGLFLYSGHVIVLRGNVHHHGHVSSPLPCSCCYRTPRYGFRRPAIIIAWSGAQEISDSCSGSPSIFGVCKLFMSFGRREVNAAPAACFQEILSNISNASPVDYNFIFHCISSGAGKLQSTTTWRLIQCPTRPLGCKCLSQILSREEARDVATIWL